MNDNLTLKEKGIDSSKYRFEPLADQTINPQRGYSATEASNALLAQIKGQLRFVDEVG